MIESSYDSLVREAVMDAYFLGSSKPFRQHRRLRKIYKQEDKLIQDAEARANKENGFGE